MTITEQEIVSFIVLAIEKNLDPNANLGPWQAAYVAAGVIWPLIEKRNNQLKQKDAEITRLKGELEKKGDRLQLCRVSRLASDAEYEQTIYELEQQLDQATRWREMAEAAAQGIVDLTQRFQDVAKDNFPANEYWSDLYLSRIEEIKAILPTPTRAERR